MIDITPKDIRTQWIVLPMFLRTFQVTSKAPKRSLVIEYIDWTFPGDLDFYFVVYFPTPIVFIPL
jgi:hypothetical protein